jgi:hypothetical protein
MQNAALQTATPARITHAERRAIRKQRATEMAEKYRAGMTLQELGDYYGITRERVRQLMTETFGITAKDGGVAKRTEAKAKAAKARRELKFMRQYGMSEKRLRKVQGDIPRSSYRGPMRAFTQQRANASLRGIGWNLTFAEWWSIWDESGKWDERGRDGYVMARHGDTGPYAVGNVKIIHAGQNQSEYIRRYWKQVKSGEKPPPRQARKHRQNKYHGLEVGQSVTRECKATPKSEQNHAYHIAKRNGWKLKTSIEEQTITVTRIS